MKCDYTMDIYQSYKVTFWNTLYISHGSWFHMRWGLFPFILHLLSRINDILSNMSGHNFFATVLYMLLSIWSIQWLVLSSTTTQDEGMYITSPQPKLATKSAPIQNTVAQTILETRLCSRQEVDKHFLLNQYLAIHSQMWESISTLGENKHLIPLRTCLLLTTRWTSCKKKYIYTIGTTRTTSEQSYNLSLLFLF